MAEFHIGLQYISMQHMGAENDFLLRIFDRCAAKTRIFSDVKVGGGAKMEFMPTPRFGPNGASALYDIMSVLQETKIKKNYMKVKSDMKQREKYQIHTASYHPLTPVT